jgi:hypothetical protein
MSPDTSILNPSVADALQRGAEALQRAHAPVDDPAPFASPRWV